MTEMTFDPGLLQRIEAYVAQGGSVMAYTGEPLGKGPHPGQTRLEIEYDATIDEIAFLPGVLIARFTPETAERIAERAQVLGFSGPSPFVAFAFQAAFADLAKEESETHEQL